MFIIAVATLAAVVGYTAGEDRAARECCESKGGEWVGGGCLKKGFERVPLKP
jgi:hypothetical protein